MIDYQIWATWPSGNSSCFAYGAKSEKDAKELLSEVDQPLLEKEFGLTNFRIEPTEVSLKAYVAPYLSQIKEP